MSTQYQVVDYEAACFPWRFHKGDSSTFSIPFEEKQEDGTFAPLDLSAYTITALVMKADERAGQVLELTVDNGGITLPTPGVVRLTISAPNSALLTDPEYTYKVVFTIDPGYRRTYVEAPIIIL